MHVGQSILVIYDGLLLNHLVDQVLLVSIGDVLLHYHLNVLIQRGLLLLLLLLLLLELKLLLLERQIKLEAAQRVSKRAEAALEKPCCLGRLEGVVVG